MFSAVRNGVKIVFNGNIVDDKDIDLLIHCPKIFKAAPKNASHINRNVTQSFTVFGQNNNLEFRVFITYSERKPEDFSLGLMYKDMLLFRCNGFHGTTRKGFFSAMHHAYPHSHKLSINDIENNRSRKPSTIQDNTGRYIDLSTAIVFFCDECGIIDYERYFPVSQLRLEGV